MKKGQNSEWDFPNFEDDIGAAEEKNKGRGSRGRGKGGRGGGRRGPKGIVEVSGRQSGDGSFGALWKASVSEDSFDAMRKKLVSRISTASLTIHFRDYDRRADRRYESAKAFPIPKKTPTSHSAATAAVRSILSEMDSVTKEISVAQEDLPIEKEKIEVTDLEVILMERFWKLLFQG